MRTKPKHRLLAGAFGLLLACCLAAGGTVAALADESSTAQDGTASSEEISDPRLANTIGFTGSQYWDEYHNFVDQLEYADRDAENAEANAPKRYEDAWGNVYQRVPADPTGWNNTWLNADSRGCMSCHKSMDDIMINMDTRHDVYINGYANQTTITNCIGCHSANPMPGKNPMSTTMHGMHNGSAAFTAMGGNCESCHFINVEGDFELWDIAKYDQFKGFTDVAAEEANLQVSYNQDQISDTEQQFFKSLWVEPSSWRTDTDEATAEQWMVSFGGEVENPLTVSVAELKEMFGTKTVTMKQNCIENGTGNAWIFQAEFTGIPMKDIIDYVKPADTVNKLSYDSEDGYKLMPISFDSVNVDDCLLVTEINGETLPVTQGWPLTLAVPGGSAADYVKAITKIDFVTNEKASSGDAEEEDPGTPNSGVLNYPDGVVLPADETVHLEGFADAFEYPITRIEYSLDGGESWSEVDTPDMDTTRWVYWTLDFDAPDAGAYLLKIRTTCVGPSGTEYVNVRDTNFMFNLE